MGFSRQEYWSGFPFLPLGDLPPAGIKPTSPASPAGGFFTAEPLEKPPPNKLLETNSWGLVYSGRWVLLGQSQLLDFDLIHWEALPQEKKLASYPWRAVWLWFSLSTFTELPLKTSAVTAAQGINLMISAIRNPSLQEEMEVVIFVHPDILHLPCEAFLHV